MTSLCFLQKLIYTIPLPERSLSWSVSLKTSVSFYCYFTMFYPSSPLTLRRVRVPLPTQTLYLRLLNTLRYVRLCADSRIVSASGLIFPHQPPPSVSVTSRRPRHPLPRARCAHRGWAGEHPSSPLHTIFTPHCSTLVIPVNNLIAYGGK